jgi:hypothetical protein
VTGDWVTDQVDKAMGDRDGFLAIGGIVHRKEVPDWGPVERCFSDRALDILATAVADVAGCRACR